MLEDNRLQFVNLITFELNACTLLFIIFFILQYFFVY